MSDYYNYDYDDNEEYGGEYEDEYDFVEHNERDVYARVSEFNNPEIELIDNVRDNKLLFPLVVQAFCLQYIKELRLNKADIDYLIKEKDKVYKYEFKNPKAYVLGYIVSNNGKKINVDKLELVKKFLISENIDDIKTEDVIRYARLWINLI